MASNDTPEVNKPEKWEGAQKRGKIVSGLAVLVAGTLLLARELGVELPWWLFTWKFWLIVFGFVIGFKHNFSRPFWIFPVLIGLAYLIVDFYPDLINRDILWPVVLMIFGAIMILRAFFPKKHNACKEDFKRRLKKQDWTQNFDQKVVSSLPLEDSSLHLVKSLL
jgi:hypothetical protein